MCSMSQFVFDENDASPMEEDVSPLRSTFSIQHFFNRNQSCQLSTRNKFALLEKPVFKKRYIYINDAATVDNRLSRSFFYKKEKEKERRSRRYQLPPNRLRMGFLTPFNNTWYRLRTITAILSTKARREEGEPGLLERRDIARKWEGTGLRIPGHDAGGRSSSSSSSIPGHATQSPSRISFIVNDVPRTYPMHAV